MQMDQRMLIKNISQRHIAFFMIIVVLIGIMPVYAVSDTTKLQQVYEAAPSYDNYLNKYKKSVHPKTQVMITADQVVETDKGKVTGGEAYGLKNAVVSTTSDDMVTWRFEVPQEGFYHIQIEYFSDDGNAAIEKEILIDGKYPFFEAQSISLQRIWENSKETMTQTNGAYVFQKDSRGNQVVPSQTPVKKWTKQYLRDAMGFLDQPYYFYFSAGTHTISLQGLREDVIINSLLLKQAEKAESYQSYLKRYEKEKKYTGQPIKLQGEYASYKSDPVLYPLTDRSSAATEPSDPTKICLNTIGGANWSSTGQWVEWSFTVPVTGLYCINIKARQNLVSGMFSTRKLYINGQIPFSEVEKIETKYDNNWKNILLSDDKQPYYFYLESGEQHTLRLEAVIGRAANIFKTAQNSVLKLNELYRRIIMLTSTAPDPLRNYHIPKVMPDVMKELQVQERIILQISKELEHINNKKGSTNTILDNLAFQLRSFINKPLSITQRLDSFRENVSALGSWVLDLSKQPLEIDYISILSPQDIQLKRLQSAKATLWQNIIYEIKAFFGSYTEDYSLIGENSGRRESINVWINTGRDQASIIKRLIVMDFTKTQNIDVNLKIAGVGGGLSTLLLSTVAGIGPDIAMSIGNGEPVNYAARGAAADISQYKDFPQVIKRFQESAMIPFEFNGRYYALPETQSFMMMYYRKDILNELDIKLPETWDQLYSIIGELQKNHMSIGIPGGDAGADLSFLGTMIYQSGGEIYSKDKSRCELDSPVSIKNFKKWCNLYTSYNLPLDYNGANRFRTGEMPIIITDYTFYNMMRVFAPELSGLWDFSEIPGTLQSDGTINNDSVASGSCIMTLATSTKKDSCWKYMKWWTSDKIQLSYGRELESLLGPSARHPSANINAMQNLPWKSKDADKLLSQWNKTKGIPEVPGGYYTGRYLENALRNTLTYGRDAREVLIEYVGTINNEITYKRKEFGLE